MGTDIIPRMAEPTAEKKPRVFRPSRAKVVVVSATGLLLLVSCTVLFLFALNYKRRYGEMVRKERARLDAGLHLEFARDNLARAERFARRPESDPAEIKEICEIAVTATSRAAGLRPDLEEPYLIRARALEMQYRFEEAESDCNQAIANYKFSYAWYGRGFLGVRRTVRAQIAGTASKAAGERWAEDLRRHIHHSQGDLQDDRNRFVSNLGVVYLDGNYAAVQPLADNAARLDPSEWMVPLLKGAALFHLGKPEAALEPLDEAVRLMPYAAEPYAWKAVVLWKLGRLPEAIEALNLALKRDEQFFEAVHLRGFVLLDSRRFEDARADFLFCARLRPSFLEGRTLAALAGLEWWLRTGRKDAELHRKILEELDAVIAADPGHVEARITRARARLEAGRAAEALPDADAALAKEPNRREALELRARIHAARRDWAAADRDWSELGNLRERARVRTSAGRFDEAIADIDTLLSRDPKDVSLHLERARIQLAAGRPDDAIATLDRLAESHPNLARAKVLRAEALLAKKDAEGAIRLATEAFLADAQLAEALIVRGKARLALGKKAEAEEDFRKALEINPELKDRIP